MVHIFEQPPVFDSFIDQVNSLFFNYNNNYKEFMERNPKELMKLPFYTDNSEVLYFGGDYIIISAPLLLVEKYVAPFLIIGSYIISNFRVIFLLFEPI